ncbi:hypothetical protein [Streptomyces sp. NBC_00102]|uniref:hypothetical protein n=1 Tax=Streptomyces sp. NBC_00102 TaxID=2975652 RepID=UPI0022510D66|nr:hypothetical protein [Streptomyces sp. NBC_00102]MCX5396602.1 hypothetical protein [Streptomyces sp. NBC_00102]
MGSTRAMGLIAALAAAAWMSAGPAVADGGSDGPAGSAARAAGTPLLQFAKPSPVTGVKPGDTVPLEITVKNAGDGPAERVTLYIGGSTGTAFAEKYSNCVQEEIPAQDEGPAQVQATCDIEQVLEPGVVYAPEEPVALTLQPRALYEWYTLVVHADSPVFHTGPRDGVGEELRFVPQETPPAGAEYLDALPFTHVTADSTADFSLTGAEVTGEKGDTVKATVTFANNGPAWVDNDTETPIGVFDVGVPPGTTVTHAPDVCHPVGPDGEEVPAAGATTYRCTTVNAYAEENETLALEFTLRIDKVVPDATGEIAFVPGENRAGTLSFDHEPGNNTAKIVVNPSEDGAADGGAGSTGGTGSTTSGGAITGTTAGTTAGGAVGGSISGGGTAPELAATGGAGPGYLAAGAGLAAAGGLALALAHRSWWPRRRRLAGPGGPAER